MKKLLVDGTRVVTLANAQRGTGVALPVGCGFVVVTAVAGCSHVGVVGDAGDAVPAAVGGEASTHVICLTGDEVGADQQREG